MACEAKFINVWWGLIKKTNIMALAKTSAKSSPNNDKARLVKRRAIIDVNIGVVIFSMQDMIIKFVSHDYAISQLMVVRSIVSLPLLLWLMARWRLDGKAVGLSAIWSPRWPWLALRGFTAVLAYNTYYLAFPVLPIAVIVSMFLTTPLFLVLFSFLFVGDKISPRQLMAIAWGFVGSLIILRPWGGMGDGFNYAGLLPIGAAIFYALSQTINRKYLQADGPLVMSAYQTLLFLVASGLATLVFHFYQFHPNHLSLVFLTRDWAMFAPRDLLLIMSTGVIGTFGMTFLSNAYRTAPAGVIAPFEYGSLLISFIAGFIIWGESPNILAMVGAFMILVAGLLIVRGDA